jgi:undecaprenyl-diphosphatase
VLLVLAASLSYIVISAMKAVFQVPRPCELLETCPESYSFPSRHAGIAFAMATAFALYFRRTAYLVIAFFLAAVVGYWRLATGLHTPIDVIVGAIIGVVIGFLVYYIYKSRHAKAVGRRSR